MKKLDDLFQALADNGGLMPLPEDKEFIEVEFNFEGVEKAIDTRTGRDVTNIIDDEYFREEHRQWLEDQPGNRGCDRCHADREDF